MATSVYPRSWRGAGLLAVDLTWSLPNTVAGLLYLLAHLAAGHRIDREMTLHSGRVYVVEPFHRNYAMTIGTVIAGATPSLKRHEDWHVFQARLLGPFYLPLVGLSYAVYTIVPLWLLRHDHEQWPIKGFTTYFTCGVYPHVWHEKWAYKRDQKDQ